MVVYSPNFKGEYMIIQKDNYRKNSKGEIVKRETIELQCDRCLTHWETKCEYYKRKKFKEDLCVVCRGVIKYEKLRLEGRQPVRGKKVEKINLICEYCQKSFERFSENKKDKNYCSTNCRDLYLVNKLYSHLKYKFTSNPNHVAYLVGLILGDGHIRSRGNLTSEIIIAFDSTHPLDISIAKNVMSVLGINYGKEIKLKSNCIQIYFSIPKELLEYYGLNYCGNKYFAQPRPTDQIIHNINFALGLFNSDGHFRIGPGNYRRLVFTNTIESISQSYQDCLCKNFIAHSYYLNYKKPDKRTEKIYKCSHITSFGKKQDVENFRKLSSFPIKGDDYVEGKF